MALLDDIEFAMQKMSEHKEAARHLMVMALDERNEASTWEKKAEELMKELDRIEREKNEQDD